MSSEALVESLTRPIIGIQNRTAEEAFDIMADRIRAALSALKLPHAGDGGWQDIATAPKDGTALLVWDGRSAFSAFWGRAGHPMNSPAWIGGHCGINHIDQPTHWRHLPTPPAGVSAR